MKTKGLFKQLALVAALAALTAACATSSYRAGQPCVAEEFSVYDGFGGARRGTCTVIGPNEVQLDIRPESSGYINDSPWYAFRLESSAAGSAIVHLQYHGGHHRYWPKTSSDGTDWHRLDDKSVSVSSNGRRATISVPLNGEPLLVSAQELILPSMYQDWNSKISDASGYPVKVLGQSRRNLPIHVFDTMPDGKDVVLLTGRQHPPEVSGAFAFFAFAETVLGSSELALRFRERFRVIAIPLLNPDGVLGGNWRHNLDGTDLNRDWGKFEQPETAAVGQLLDDIDASGSQLRILVDFHSTSKNLFYTLPDPTTPPNFNERWLANAGKRVVDYPFENTVNPASSPYVAKNYIYARYGIPTITFEAGDESDRTAVGNAAVIFAEELMLLMLAQTY